MAGTPIEEPMTLSYLNMLTDILLNESEELQNEFDRKLNFIKNQERVCLDNGKELSAVSMFIDAINSCILQTEIELQQNQEELMNLEKIVSRFEIPNTEIPTSPTTIPLNSNDYLAFLELMLAADQSTAQNMQLRGEIDEYNQQMSDRLMNPKLIINIMDYHVKAMCSLEEQIAKAQREVIEVTNWHGRIAQQIESKLNTTPPK